ncbi:abortive infection system antitoxin AbiGi family protein [Listeria seeligeri]|uniref:abortive infection system antitoxin AbiGi family protein n=1 Tax=Listeria seeligeri TaxID=1640 RepID=UPI0022EAB968|nr:abortive infection system antitoxin AbiGi family protein [Listeria seeligeri]
MMDNKQVIDAGDQDKCYDYHQSANTLFHFMSELDYLLHSLTKQSLLPRYVLENVEYLKLDYKGQQVKWLLIPMLCFCDINLHKLSMHVGDNQKTGTKEGYGQYGIGLDKKWCEQMGLQPISYLNGNASQTEMLGLVLNQGLELMDPYKIDKSNENLYDFIITQVALSKPLRGQMKKETTEVQKNFHDEREWRFIPNLEGLTSPEFLNDVTTPEIMNLPFRRDLSNAMQAEKDTHLKLKINIIKYIFVSNLDDRDKVLELLSMNFSREEALEMATKIVIYDQIVKDW